MAESTTPSTPTIDLTTKLARESQRDTPESWRTIYLYTEGTFLRCFDQSAWLLSTYVYNDHYRATIPNAKPLTVKHTRSKRSASYLVVGFPSRSLPKFVGNCPCSTSGNVITVTIPDSMFPASMPGEYQAAFDTFKQSIPIEDPHPERASSPEVALTGSNRAAHGHGIFDIIKSLVLYNLEEHTPLEAQAFLADLKRRVNSIL